MEFNIIMEGNLLRYEKQICDLSDFISVVSNFKEYVPKKNRSEELEGKVGKFPSFIAHFFDLLLHNNLFDVREFCHSYFKKHEKDGKFKRISDIEFEYRGFVYRILDLFSHLSRGYPSLLREFHFYLLFNSMNVSNYSMKYSFELDVFSKFDYELKHTNSDIPIYIKLYVSSPRSIHYLSKKDTSSNIDASEEQIYRAVLDLTNAEKINTILKNGIFLYSEEHVKKMLLFADDFYAKFGNVNK